MPQLAADNNTFWDSLSPDNKLKHRKHPSCNFTVSSEKDLARLLTAHPTICALPEDDREKLDLASLAPNDKKYVYIMMDSGASLHAADLEQHFPGHVLEETDASRRGDYALTANGGKLYNLGSFRVEGMSNGIKVSLGFSNMKVDVPVASVRTFVKNGNEVDFFDGGGVVRSKETGAGLPFIELGGVYFLKLKIKPPRSSLVGKASLVFARPGP